MLKLPILTLLVVAGVAASGCQKKAADPQSADAVAEAAAYLLVRQPDQPTEGDNYLTEAIRRLGLRHSIRSQIHIQANMLGETVTGAGNYLEVEPGGDRRLRFEVNFKIDKTTTSLIHVCDGHNFWIYRHVGKDTFQQHLDLGRLSDAIRSTPGREGQGLAMLLPETGGLPKLLQRIRYTFWFPAVSTGQLKDQLPVWRLEGQWKANWLWELLPDQRKTIEKGLPVDARKLPSHIPDRVVIYLGQDDLFPYRIEFFRMAPIPYVRGLPPVVPREPLLMAMQWSGVIFDEPLDPAFFQYQPGAQKSNDNTINVIQAFGLTEKR